MLIILMQWQISTEHLDFTDRCWEWDEFKKRKKELVYGDYNN